MKRQAAVFFALLAAALYAVNVPLSKLFLSSVAPTVMAGLLYLGAGLGIGIVMLSKKLCGIKEQREGLSKNDLGYTVAMVVLDIIAPIFLMYGVNYATAANASLLNNFEIVATSLIALVFFKEKISKKLLTAILLVVVASVILTFEPNGALVFNKGSLLVLAAALSWGLENNCTRSISDKKPEEIVLIKGVFSGGGSLVVAFALGEELPALLSIVGVMLLGFVAYGLSITFYIMAQSKLGAAKTSAFYAIAPFLGVGFSFLILKEIPRPTFYLGLVIMLASTAVMIWDTMTQNRKETP